MEVLILMAVLKSISLAKMVSKPLIWPLRRPRGAMRKSLRNWGCTQIMLAMEVLILMAILKSILLDKMVSKPLIWPLRKPRGAVRRRLRN